MFTSACVLWPIHLTRTSLTSRTPINVHRPLSDLYSDGRIDTVDNARDHLLSRFPNDPQCKREPHVDAECVHKDRQAREAVNADVMAISGQCRAADLLANADAKHCNGFVAHKADK